MNRQSDPEKTTQTTVPDSGASGAAHLHAETASTAAPHPTPPRDGKQAASGRASNRLQRLLVPMVLVFLVVGALITYRFWYDDAFYVSTDNARIAGALIQVGALNAGRIEGVTADVGGRVERDQLLATVALPSVLSVAQGTSKMGFVGTNELLVEVRSPLAGVVVARNGNVGDTIAAGQPILTVVDPNALWVVANVEETKIARLGRGQTVDARVDALGRSFAGHVETITPATASTFSLLPQQNSSGNFTKVTQLVPVKIRLDAGGYTLPLGGSVGVRIRVAEPDGWLSWLR